MSLGEDGHSQLGAGFKVTAHECRPPVMIVQQLTLAGLPGRAASRRWFCLSSSLVDYVGRRGIGCGVDRVAASETVDEGSDSSILVDGQDASGVAWADAHEFSGLVQANVLDEEAVQDLKPGLFRYSAPANRTICRRGLQTKAPQACNKQAYKPRRLDWGIHVIAVHKCMSKAS